MPQTIYEKLRNQLDQYSNGFPETESGVELKILKKLFSEEEADLYLNMSLRVETPESVAQRTGRDIQGLKRQLEKMAKKGLKRQMYDGIRKKNGPKLYHLMRIVRLGKLWDNRSNWNYYQFIGSGDRIRTCDLRVMSLVKTPF